jgi:penicillin amidase
MHLPMLLPAIWYENHLVGETRDDVLRLALRRPLDDLARRLGPDMTCWAWGRLHTLTLSHPLSATRTLAPFFNRGPWPLGGDASTVWATGANQHDLDENLRGICVISVLS